MWPDPKLAAAAQRPFKLNRLRLSSRTPSRLESAEALVGSAISRGITVDTEPRLRPRFSRRSNHSPAGSQHGGARCVRSAYPRGRVCAADSEWFSLSRHGGSDSRAGGCDLMKLTAKRLHVQVAFLEGILGPPIGLATFLLTQPPHWPDRYPELPGRAARRDLVSPHPKRPRRGRIVQPASCVPYYVSSQRPLRQLARS